MSYCYIWEFLVPSESVDTFEREYGPEGKWVALFRKSAGYQRTELLRDEGNRFRFLTVDYWDSRDAYEEFLKIHRDDYAAIDRSLEGLASKETLIGHFCS